MSEENRSAIAGSDKKALAAAQSATPIAAGEIIQVTIVLRRRHDHPAISQDPAAYTPHVREEYGTIHGADPSDIQAIESFAHEYNLTVVERDAFRRTVVVSGIASDIQRAFGTQLHRQEVNGHSFRLRSGALSVPSNVHPAIMAVLGLDNRPAAKPHFRRRANAPETEAGGQALAADDAAKAAVPAGAFTPVQLARLYNFPQHVTGAGQTIAIIELGGGFRSADITAYFKSLGLTAPKVTAVAVDGGLNKPGDDADGEVMLDIEVAGAVAPGAAIAVYFAPNTDQGFHDAISMAVHDATRKPSVISISWGGPEDSWTAQSRDAMNAALQDAAAMGVTVTAASGDDGSTDGETDGKQHVDFPASSPYALACGGTKVVANGTQITSEVVWNELAAKEGATGGGVSAVFPLPAYQKSAGVPPNPDTKFVGRGVPDVSGDADPQTGYYVRVDGKNTVIGGTSAVAPLWAGLTALLNQQLGHSIGFVNPKLYAISAASFRGITAGNNGFFSAGPKWDACTGQGSPNGVALATALAAIAASKVTT